MTLRAKQQLTSTALIAFAIWPLVHRGLVAQYGITPWKFMGFAMYCMPTVEPLVNIYAYYGERRAEVDPRQAELRDLRREVARFVTFRGVWGELLAPDLIGEVALGILTRAEKLQVVVTEGYLDREIWRLAARERVYDYHATPRADSAESPQLRKSLDRSINRVLKRGPRGSPGPPGSPGDSD